MCKRKTSDPLMREFLDRYGLNLLSIPRKNAACGDLYVASGARVSTPGRVTELLLPAPELPPVTDEEMADLSGIVSKGVSLDIGLGLLEKLLAAFGAIGLSGSLKTAYESSSSFRIHFRFRDATRDSVDPLALGMALRNSRLDVLHPLIAEGNRYFVVAGVVRTQSISVITEDARSRAIDMDLGVLQLAEVHANVEAQRTASGEVTYTGASKLAIGVELYELTFEREQERLLMKLPKKPPRVVRGRSAPPVEPAFIGGREADAFITVS